MVVAVIEETYKMRQNEFHKQHQIFRTNAIPTCAFPFFQPFAGLYQGKAAYDHVVHNLAPLRVTECTVIVMQWGTCVRKMCSQ